jgi:hypothetical protein
MPRSKLTIAEQIANAKEDIKQGENRLKLLNQRQKEQERKARNHRLCSRGGYLESKLPEVITLTDEQYYSFLEKTLFTEHSRRILNGLTEQNTPTHAPKPIAETETPEAE